jgi:hypothetical protein
MSQSHDPGAHAHARQEPLTCPRLQELQKQIVEITKRHAAAIQRVCADGTVKSEELKGLEAELTGMGLRPNELSRISGNQELRRFLGLVLSSHELGSSGAYRLQHLDRVLATQPQAFSALFSSPVLAQTLGAVLTSPTFYHEFSQNRDALALELVAIKLRNVLSTEQFSEWQRCAARSLLWSYQGVQESPSPEVYAKKVQLSENSFVFDSEQIREMTSRKIHQLVQIREPIPGMLWEILSPGSRRDVSLHLPMDDVLAWTRERLREIACQSQRHYQSCQKFEKQVSAGARAARGREILPKESAAALQSEFEQHCSSMYETCRFLLLYLDDKMKNLGQDPIRERLAPQCQGDRVAQSKDAACYENGRLREIVQKAVGGGLVSAMRRLCESMACKAVELKCSEKFAQGVVELLDELNLYLDVQDEGRFQKPFYAKYLIPCFQQAVERRDFESARAIRLLFPPDDRDAPTVKRFLVDDYIRAHREDLLNALAAEASTLSQMMDQPVRQKMLCLPAGVAQRLRSFQSALRHFPLEESISAVDVKLVGAVATVVYALLTWDAVVENTSQRAENDDHVGSMGPSPLRAFIGCRRAAELLATLGSDSPAQRCTMTAVLSQTDLRPREALAEFIMHTNFQLVQALQALAAAKVTLNDILPECQAAFDADRMYRASPGQHDRLPEVMIRYFPPLLEVGYHILVHQEDMVPPEGLTVIRANDLNCVRSWQAGVVGDGHHPHRHHLMRKFFEFVQRNGGDVPLHARSLVLQSVAHFAEEFAVKVEKAVDEHEFVRGVSHVLSGFLISAQRLDPEQHIAIARSLARIFATPSAGFLCNSDEHRYAVVQSFKSLARVVKSHDLNETMGEFLKHPAIRALLQNVGILQRDKGSPLPDTFQPE